MLLFPSHIRRQSQGFTLVEVLIVIAIFAVLLGLLLPAVQKLREASNRLNCSNNLKLIGVACLNYQDTHGSFPPGGVTPGTTGSKSKTGWAIELLPFLELDELYKKYSQLAFNEDPANEVVRTTLVRAYVCPSDLGTDQVDVPGSGPACEAKSLYARGSYKAVSGASLDPKGRAYWDHYEPATWSANGSTPPQQSWKGVFHHQGDGTGVNPWHGPESASTILDGTSNTLMFGEYATINTIDRRAFWAYTYASYSTSSVSNQSRILTNDYQKCYKPDGINIGGAGGDNPCKRAFSSMHTNGLNFVFADGSTRFISYHVDINMLAGMASIAGTDPDPQQ